MRTVPAGLATRLERGSSNLCFILTIEKADGTTLYLTEADTDLTVDSQVYTSVRGLLVGSIPYGVDGYSSGVDIEIGIDTDTVITPDDIADGVFEKSVVTLKEVDFTIPNVGGVQVFWGLVTNITRTVEGIARITANGILAQSHQILVHRYNPNCIYHFCDPDCGLAENDFKYFGAITSRIDDYTIGIEGAVSALPEAAGLADNFFIDGVLEFYDGVREGLRIEIRSSSSTEIKLFLALPDDVPVGTHFHAIRGCRKRFEDCQDYDNHLRFGGQPRAGSPEEAANVNFIDWES
jgi:uncharacterized phage protein (TIGR02218 family)